MPIPEADPARDAVGNPLDAMVGSLLDDQRDLTAVERFAQFHDDGPTAVSRASLLGRSCPPARRGRASSSPSRSTSTAARAARRAWRPATRSTGWTTASRGATSA